ncbi:putative dehydrogenase [Stackebrandtia endophytica]|uniref:Putative dehydrogenase n=1 Tax=Stackebrandtia endophytica TaxID=1496996 RepID=A0A543ASX1_9ACTN|nr:Gfo/Idh/MocA family oxidoreductase [Stackebrandtia endophytica]TQL75679.1 putative dehydrogenase [Stackebrandtia endophytica]
MSMGVGIIGAGVISDTYLANLNGFGDVSVRFVADLDTARAAAQATRHDVADSGTVAQLLERDDVELVVNLTVPAAHAEVGSAVLESGRHLWQEKPLATNRTDAAKLLELAEANGLRVACAPDTVLGPGIQTARRAVESGRIGRPITGLALFQSRGPDAWHPGPEFLFQAGAGPLFDIGPYYLTTLALVFGPVRRVTATGTRARTRRTIQAGPRAGTVFDVTEPTTVNALIEFVDGGSAQLLMSFDSGVSRTCVEVTAEHGSLILPDPNGFDGDTRLCSVSDAEELTFPAAGHTATRGIGVLDLARSIRAGVPERAGGRLAYHVLDVMVAVDEAARRGEPVAVESRFDPIPLLPDDWDPFARTL